MRPSAPSGESPADETRETHLPARPPHIDWTYSGAPDPVAGTGATWAEQALMWAAGLGAAAFMIFLANNGYVAWGWFPAAIAAVVAFDLVGGAVAFNLNSAKRFYHSAPQASERGFVRWMKGRYWVPAVHFHPVLVYFLFRPDDWLTGIAIYLGTAASAALVRLAPYHLARPLAVLLVLASVFVAVYGPPAVPGFEWLLPVLFLKVVLGFGVREEPYRPRPREERGQSAA